MTAPLTLGRDLCGNFEQSVRREWLVTNGLGGFAAGTIGGCLTRRYHGLLIAAEKPPVGRTVRLVDLDVTLRVAGREYELACHEYAGGVIHPTGHRLLESFRLEGTVPTWTYALGPARLVKRVFMARGQNTSYVRYTLERSTESVTLSIRPLATGRDYHWHRRGESGYYSEALGSGCRVGVDGIAPTLALASDAGAFVADAGMHWNVWHRAEAARGLDAEEDLYSPGVFDLELEPGATCSITATIERVATPVEQALADLRRHEATLAAGVGADAPAWIRQLALAADQFIVARRAAPGTAGDAADGVTVIAGYPWFSDWGRDTMIALPGLTLATGRPELAARILRTFAAHTCEGLLPNRFPDAGEAPEYNTVDATLWYFIAVHEYLAATGDLALARDLYPVMAEIVDWHRRGTRHGIAVDPADGLLRAGEPGVQLTWMDAKVGDWVVTPRIGKPVEIAALWCNALAILGAIAERLGEQHAAREYREQAGRATQAFAAKFWNEDGQYLYDVIDGHAGAAPDATLRPNQLLALALPYPLLDRERARAALAVCERELMTSAGLRTLAPGHADYVGHYGGDPRQRDGAYHQGTVWPWLAGAFVRARAALDGDPRAVLAYLAPFESQLTDGCVGQISEIFDADPPHAPQGCFAQAWSVAELLRAWREVSRLGAAQPVSRRTREALPGSRPRTRKAS